MDSLSGPLISGLAFTLDPSQSSKDARLQWSGGNGVAVRVPSCVLESHRHTAHMCVIYRYTPEIHRTARHTAEPSCWAQARVAAADRRILDTEWCAAEPYLALSSTT